MAPEKGHWNRQRVDPEVIGSSRCSTHVPTVEDSTNTMRYNESLHNSNNYTLRDRPFEAIHIRSYIMIRRVRAIIRQNKNFCKVALLSALLLIFSVGNVIWFKKMLDKMPNYSPFLAQFTTGMYIPVFFGAAFYEYIIGRLSQETMNLPKKHYAYLGALDALGSILVILGGVYTSGTTQVVFAQSQIPFSILFSILLLGKRFSNTQFIGAGVIILGVFIDIYPDLQSTPSTTTVNVIPFNILFFLGSIPFALSSVYREAICRKTKMSICYLNGWVALFQLLIGFCFLPLTSLPMLGNQRVPLSDLPANFEQGAKCLFLGMNTITTNCGEGFLQTCDSCEGAWYSVGMYTFFNIVYNGLVVAIVKKFGAALQFLILTLRLPISSIAFCSTLIMGAAALAFRLTDFFALVVLLSGLGVYKMGSGSGRRRRHSGYSEVIGGSGYDSEDEASSTFAPVIVHNPAYLKVDLSDGESSKSHDDAYFGLDFGDDPEVGRSLESSTNSMYMPPTLNTESHLRER